MNSDAIGTAAVLALVELALVGIFAEIQGLKYLGVLIILGAFNALCLHIGGKAR